MHIVDNSKIV